MRRGKMGGEGRCGRWMRGKLEFEEGRVDKRW